MILGIIDFHSIIRIVFLKDFPLFFKIFKAFVTQKAVIYHTYHFFPLGKYLLRLTQYDIKIRISSEPANIGMSSNQLHIRILNAEKHDRYLQRQRISTGKKSIESFITCCYNQIGLPVTSTLTKTTHNYFLGVECPKIGIKILRCYIHLQATFFKSFDQPLIKVAMPRSL